MSARYDESELLDLIEGRLDAGKAAALEARLAGDGAARMQIEHMRADRALLKSLPEPELPMDFLAQSEHLLARPMLMEPVTANVIAASAKPGQYRRQQQKLRWRVRWPRLAAAAIVLLALGAGVWQLTVAVWPHGSGSQSNLLAIETTENGGIGGNVEAPAVDVRELAGVIHHALPGQQAIALAITGHRDADKTAESAVASAARPGHGAVDAEFALVIRTRDAGSTEQAIARMLAEMPAQSALVRNFSFDEARRLDNEWRVANAGRGANPPQPNAVADVSGKNHALPKVHLKELAEHVRARLQSATANGGPSSTTKDALSGCVAGLKELSPPLEQQLALSSRGATHVLVIPAGELQAVLAELGLDATQATSLRMLPNAPGVPAAMSDARVAAMPVMPTLEAWLAEGPRVREAMQQVSAQGSRTLVRVPVVVEVGAK